MKNLTAILAAVLLVGCSTTEEAMTGAEICRKPDTGATEIASDAVEREFQRLRLEWRACYRDAQDWRSAYRKAIRRWRTR